jgi:hypothetical protein
MFIDVISGRFFLLFTSQQLFEWMNEELCHVICGLPEDINGNEKCECSNLFLC